jgi:hypothetical protein
MAALAGGAEGKGALDEAVELLSDLLRDGPMGPKEIKKVAEEAGVAWSTIRRAKHRLDVVSLREGGIGEDGRWVWRLPKQTKIHTSKGEHLSHLSPMDSPKAPKAPNPEPGQLSEDAAAYDFEERAATLEYDSGPSRDETEGEPDLSSNGVAGDMPSLHKRIGD